MPQAEEKQFRDRYNLRKMARRLMYVLLAVIVFFIVKKKFLTPPEVTVAQVVRQNVKAEVQGSGTVGVDVLAKVGAKIPGRIERILVDEGEFVHSGQIIAELEDTDIQRDLQRAQAHLAGARAALEARKADVLARRATVQARRATEWQTSRAWEREKHLLATGAVSQEEADQYEEQYETAASGVGVAQADVGAAERQVAAAQREVQAAEADVRLQQFNLSETKIFTYVSGVVENFPKRPGDAIVPGEPVVSIVAPNLTMVNTFVDQRFSGEIMAGQPATVLLWGREAPIQGRVYRISPQADPATEEMTVEVTFPLSPKDLEIGQWADVYIQTREMDNALAVPASAIMTSNANQFVFVTRPDGRVRRINVHVLASSPRSPVVAVQGNLKPGDQVLTKPMGIHAGEKVQAEPPQAGGSSS
ncbi:MAG: efflux RND transporter periplasmic adaptor subunit [Candidatus Acidiferrales bacterium]